MYPQFLITVDEQLEEKAITVRVGQAVNTVGLAGQRMGISGVSHNVNEESGEANSADFSRALQFQTHQTPVRIAVGERAEFGTNEYFPYASTLEGIVSRRLPAYSVASKLIGHHLANAGHHQEERFIRSSGRCMILRHEICIMIDTLSDDSTFFTLITE